MRCCGGLSCWIYASILSNEEEWIPCDVPMNTFRSWFFPSIALPSPDLFPAFSHLPMLNSNVGDRVFQIFALCLMFCVFRSTWIPVLVHLVPVPWCCTSYKFAFFLLFSTFSPHFSDVFALGFQRNKSSLLFSARLFNYDVRCTEKKGAVDVYYLSQRLSHLYLILSRCVD